MTFEPRGGSNWGRRSAALKSRTSFPPKQLRGVSWGPPAPQHNHNDCDTNRDTAAAPAAISWSFCCMAAGNPRQVTNTQLKPSFRSPTPHLTVQGHNYDLYTHSSSSVMHKLHLLVVMIVCTDVIIGKSLELVFWKALYKINCIMIRNVSDGCRTQSEWHNYEFGGGLTLTHPQEWERGELEQQQMDGVFLYLEEKSKQAKLQ